MPQHTKLYDYLFDKYVETYRFDDLANIIKKVCFDLIDEYADQNDHERLLGLLTSANDHALIEANLFKKNKSKQKEYRRLMSACVIVHHQMSVGNCVDAECTWHLDRLEEELKDYLGSGETAEQWMNRYIGC